MSAIIFQGYVTQNRIVTCGYESSAETPPDPPAEPVEYSLTILAGANGSTSPSVGVYDYPEGTELSLSATPADGYRFRYWQKADLTYMADNPWDYTVTQDETLTPVFQLIPPETPVAPGALKFSTLWDHLLYGVEKQGVDCTVTLHALQLGDADNTGRFAETFTDSAVKMVINPSGTDLSLVGAGRHSQLKAKAYCKVNVVDGDEVTDSFGNVWRVASAYPFLVGDVVAYYDLELDLKLATGTGSTHPPAYSHKRLNIRVIDGSANRFTTGNLSIHVIDLDLLANNTFPYTFTFTLA